MSSAETPEDPGTPPPPDQEARRSLRFFIGSILALAIIALAIVPLAGRHPHQTAHLIQRAP